MTEKRFSRDRFAKEHGCQVYDLSPDVGARTKYAGLLGRLLDHGFIASAAVTWDRRLVGHEMVIVARTYCGDDEIDNPPDGLRCIRLDASVLGADHGTAIAVVIAGATPAAEAVLSACVQLPANLLPAMLPLHMVEEGWGTVVSYPPGPKDRAIVRLAIARP